MQSTFTPHSTGLFLFHMDPSSFPPTPAKPPANLTFVKSQLTSILLDARTGPTDFLFL